MRYVMRWAPELGTRWQLHLKGRALTQERLNPDAATMHIDDLLGNREPMAGVALGLGIATVDVMEVLKDARLMFSLCV